MGKKKDFSRPKAGLGYVGLGFELIIPILIGVFIGQKLDGAEPDFPLWTLLLSLLGIVVGFYSFFKEIQRIQKRSEENDEDDNK